MNSTWRPTDDMPVMGYRYKNMHGKVKTGDTASARSSVFYRMLATMQVGERRTNALRSAGIVWIERTR